MTILFIIVLSLLMSCIFPYPIFDNVSYLSSNQLKLINDKQETESYATSSLPKIDVLNLDWFEVVNSLMPYYEKIQIIDVETKKEYYVMRTGGHNHADVETIDSANTAIFKSLYSNTWSWTRRPVWVKINNQFVAASINGMPHGYSTISSNKENGHTCIHFLNSKTHGTKRVDEAHQNAVSTAYNRANELITYLNKTSYKM